MLDPPAARCIRHHMPVVERLVEDHRRTLARGEHDPAVGYAGQRQPGLELRVDRIRVITVVEDLVVQGAAGHHQVVEAAACQRLLGASAQHGQVVGIQGAGVLLDHCGGSTRKTALDSAGYRRNPLCRNRHSARRNRCLVAVFADPLAQLLPMLA
ncbi:hypothetical protein D3C72_1790700 [compost metagenome]